MDRPSRSDLEPWQQIIADSAEVYDDTTINFVFDENDERGDDAASILDKMEIAIRVPAYVRPRHIGSYIIDRPPGKCYVIDVDYDLSEDELRDLWLAIEGVKDGMVFDLIRAGRRKMFDRPAVWVFIKKWPEELYLRPGKLVFWRIDGHGKLSKIPQPISRLWADHQALLPKGSVANTCEQAKPSP